MTMKHSCHTSLFYGRPFVYRLDKAAGSVEASNTLLPFHNILHFDMNLMKYYIYKCSQCFVTDANISCAKCKTAFCVTTHRDKVQDEEAAHITPPHNTVFL